MIKWAWNQEARTRAEAAAWFARLRGAGEDLQLQRDHVAWRDADRARVEEYERMTDVWRAVDVARDKALEHLAVLSSNHRPSASRLPASSGSRARRAIDASRFWASAAIIAIMVIGGAYLYRTWQSAPQHVEIYATAIGEQRSMVLADGSRITLNTRSQVRVMLNDRVRELDLSSGEAFFDVAPDASRPFIVKGGGLAVRAVGTRFNVRVETDATRVAVVDGRVSIVRSGKEEASGSDAPLMLDRGRQVEFLPAVGTLQVQPAEPGSVLAWQQGKLILERATVADVSREIERYHPVTVDLVGRSASDVTISGAFDAQDLDSMLQAVRALMPVEIERQADHVRITARPEKP